MDDLISRQAVINAINKEMNNDYLSTFTPYARCKDAVRKLPSVTQEKTGHCKDCKYFEYDSVAIVDGIPLIVAHEICSKWGDGCKTWEDGYCFLFEPKESEEDNG